MGQHGSEIRLLTWAGVVVGIAALAAALLLPGSQSWLCRNGVRLACDSNKTQIKKLALRHQRIPRSADATMLRDFLASRLSFSGEAAPPIPCDEVEPLLAAYERQQVEMGRQAVLQRGTDDFVMVDIELAYPSSDTPLNVEVEVTLRTPKLENGIAGFGLDTGPFKQRVTLQSPAGSGDCTASFLIGFSKDRDGLATASWPAGSYTADVDVRGGADAHVRTQFTMP